MRHVLIRDYKILHSTSGDELHWPMFLRLPTTREFLLIKYCNLVVTLIRTKSFCFVFYSSAGFSGNGSALFNNQSCRPISCPPGEINITDIALGPSGMSLYTAAGNNVRTWDLRM